jgi:hypothetical protein
VSGLDPSRGRERRRRPPALLAFLLVLVCACGVAPTAEPQPVTEAPAPADVPGRPTSTGVVQIYLVRADRLVPVDRVGRTAEDALTLLAAGPTPLDDEAQLVTLLPERAIGRADRRDPDVLTVEIDPGVTALPADRQRLAVAQIVWTATGVCCDAQVRLVVDGRPVAVATDGGQADRPVRRDDYRSVAPA